MRESPILPFGRHRGETVLHVVDADRNYAHWLMGHPWFKRKYPKHYSELRRLLVKRLTAEIAEEEELRELAKLPREFKFISAGELCGRDLA
jgi:hypothetical protein